MAVKTPVQGTAAEIIKLAMIEVERRLQKEGLRSRMVLSIHDELLFDAKRDEIPQLEPIIRDAMEHAMSLKVPLKVEMGRGENWLLAAH